MPVGFPQTIRKHPFFVHLLSPGQRAATGGPYCPHLPPAWGISPYGGSDACRPPPSHLVASFLFSPSIPKDSGPPWPCLSLSRFICPCPHRPPPTASPGQVSLKLPEASGPGGMLYKTAGRTSRNPMYLLLLPGLLLSRLADRRPLAS